MIMRRFLLTMSLSLLGVSGAAFAQTSPYSLTPCTSLEACNQEMMYRDNTLNTAYEKMQQLQNPSDAQLIASIREVRDAQITRNVYADAYTAYYNQQEYGEPLEAYYPSFDPVAISEQYAYLSDGITQSAFYLHRNTEETDPEGFYSAMSAMGSTVGEQTYSENYQVANPAPSTGGGGTTPPADPGTGTGSGGTANPPATPMTGLSEITDKFSASDITIGVLAIGAVLAVVAAAVHGAKTVLRLLAGDEVQHSAEDIAEYKRRMAEIDHEAHMLSRQQHDYNRRESRKSRGFKTLRNK